MSAETVIQPGDEDSFYEHSSLFDAQVLGSEDNAQLRSSILSQYAEVEDSGSENAEADTISEICLALL